MRTCGEAEMSSSWEENAFARVSLDALVVLIARRLMLGADVAAVKFIDGGQIDDPVREKEILDWVANRLCGDSVGRHTAMAFFRDQIVANKVIQRGLHEHWRENPADFPVRWRRLAEEIRPQLDVINRHMLMMLLQSAPPLSEEQVTAARDLLDLKLGAGLLLRPLGGIRGSAARISVRSLGHAG
jgi:chorismate mutase